MSVMQWPLLVMEPSVQVDLQVHSLVLVRQRRMRRTQDTEASTMVLVRLQVVRVEMLVLTMVMMVARGDRWHMMLLVLVLA